MTLMFLGAAILLGALLFSHRQGRAQARSFESSPLLTPSERRFYMRLLHALPDHFVFAQVSPAKVLEIRSASRKALADHERVSREAFDFVICNQESLPVAVVELDAREPDRKGRMAPLDRSKDDLCAAAGLRFVRFRANALPDRDAIREAVFPPSHAREAAQQGQARVGRVAPRLS
ncbi:MAG TPA: DUF2726 domain-containing protein [Nevskiaceae bacterium]|nr:DUF2726 domain-containing protein [Nevskiaceae bacterium]